MSHITIIISRASPITTDTASVSDEPSYHYSMSVPHNTTPQQVGEMVRKAFKRLEAIDDTDS